MCCTLIGQRSHLSSFKYQRDDVIGQLGDMVEHLTTEETEPSLKREIWSLFLSERQKNNCKSVLMQVEAKYIFRFHFSFQISLELSPGWHKPVLLSAAICSQYTFIFTFSHTAAVVYSLFPLHHLNVTIHHHAHKHRNALHTHGQNFIFDKIQQLTLCIKAGVNRLRGKK